MGLHDQPTGLRGRLADAIGGVLLGLATRGFVMLPGAGFSVKGTAALIFLMTLAWLWVAWRLRGEYVTAIERSIHQHRLDTERLSTAAVGSAVRDTLAIRLRSNDPDVVSDTLDTLTRLKMPAPWLSPAP